MPFKKAPSIQSKASSQLAEKIFCTAFIVCTLLFSTATPAHCDWFALQILQGPTGANALERLGESGYPVFSNANGDVILGFFSEEFQAEQAGARQIPYTGKKRTLLKVSAGKGTLFWTPALPDARAQQMYRQYKSAGLPMLLHRQGSRPRLAIYCETTLLEERTVTQPPQAPKKEMAGQPAPISDETPFRSDSFVMQNAKSIDKTAPAAPAEQDEISPSFQEVKNVQTAPAYKRNSGKITENMPMLGAARAEKDTYLGVVFGPEFSSDARPSYMAEDMGFGGGVILRQDLNEYWTYGGSALLSYHKAKNSADYEGGKVDFSGSVRELSLSAEILYNIISDRQLRFYLLGCGGMSFFDYNVQVTETGTAKSYDKENTMTPTLGGGLGIQYTFRPEDGFTFGAEVRYKQYLNPDHGGPDYSIIPMLTGGYRF